MKADDYNSFDPEALTVNGNDIPLAEVWDQQTLIFGQDNEVVVTVNGGQVFTFQVNPPSKDIETAEMYTDDLSIEYY